MDEWEAAVGTLIDKRLDLDIAVKYYADLNGIYDDATPAAAENFGFDGYLQKYSNGSPDTNTDGVLYTYNAAADEYTSESAAYTQTEVNYSARSVLIATAESDYELAQAQWENNNALIAKLTLQHAIAEADSDADEDAMNAARDTW